MTFRHLYRLGLVLFLAVFFAVQTASVSHAVSFGDAPHDHDGQVCVLGVIAGHDDVAAVPDIPTTPTLIITATPTEHITRPYAAPLKTIAARAPPPRGPPSHL